MEINIIGTAKEIADLVSQLQSQQHVEMSIVSSDRNAYDLVIENYHKWEVGNKIGRA